MFLGDLVLIGWLVLNVYWDVDMLDRWVFILDGVLRKMKMIDYDIGMRC